MIRFVANDHFQTCLFNSLTNNVHQLGNPKLMWRELFIPICSLIALSHISMEKCEKICVCKCVFRLGKLFVSEPSPLNLVWIEF